MGLSQHKVTFIGTFIRIPRCVYLGIGESHQECDD